MVSEFQYDRCWRFPPVAEYWIMIEEYTMHDDSELDQDDDTMILV
jgi:hypothetical protein